MHGDILPHGKESAKGLIPLAPTGAGYAEGL